MEKLRVPSLIAILLTALFFISSCSNANGNEGDSDTITSNQDGEDENSTSEDQQGNTDASSGDVQQITLYRVVDGDLRKIIDYPVSGQNMVYQEDIRKHQEIWGLIKKIVPSNHLDRLNEFLIYNGETGQSSGFVTETSPDLSKWKIGIAINNASDQVGLIYTVIHQFGHLLTLNNGQINSSIAETSCSNYFTKKGCANPSSYINELHVAYWEDIWSDYKIAQGNEDAMQQFYNTYQSRFVTQYASISPVEDIAEIFVSFVIRNDTDFGASLADKKIQLMYGHSELVASRNYIRENFDVLSSRFGPTPVPGNWHYTGFRSLCLEK